MNYKHVVSMLHHLYTCLTGKILVLYIAAYFPDHMLIFVMFYLIYFTNYAKVDGISCASGFQAHSDGVRSRQCTADVRHCLITLSRESTYEPYNPHSFDCWPWPELVIVEFNSITSIFQLLRKTSVLPLGEYATFFINLRMICSKLAVVMIICAIMKLWQSSLCLKISVSFQYFWDFTNVYQLLGRTKSWLVVDHFFYS